MPPPNAHVDIRVDATDGSPRRSRRAHARRLRSHDERGYSPTAAAEHLRCMPNLPQALHRVPMPTSTTHVRANVNVGSNRFFESHAGDTPADVHLLRSRLRHRQARHARDTCSRWRKARVPGMRVPRRATGSRLRIVRGMRRRALPRAILECARIRERRGLTIGLVGIGVGLRVGPRHSDRGIGDAEP